MGAWDVKVRRIRSKNIWLLSKGNRILYRGKASPWTPGIVEIAMRREGIRLIG